MKKIHSVENRKAVWIKLPPKIEKKIKYLDMKKLKIGNLYIIYIYQKIEQPTNRNKSTNHEVSINSKEEIYRDSDFSICKL